jgi:hypothetical protein
MDVAKLFSTFPELPAAAVEKIATIRRDEDCSDRDSKQIREKAAQNAGSRCHCDPGSSMAFKAIILN